MINWTVGSGGTYANWAAVLAALPATLDDDYTVTQISDTDEGDGLTGFTTIDRAGYDLVFTSESPHNGDPTQGWSVTAPSILASRRLIALYFSGAGGGNFEMKNLKFDTSGSTNPCFFHVIIWEDMVSGYCLVHDCIIRGLATSTSNQVGFLVRTLETASVHAWNLVVRDCVGGTGSIGIKVENSYATSILYLENSTVHGCMRGIDVVSTAGGTLEVRNCCAFGDSDVDYQLTGSANGYNNASEDGTAETVWSSGSGNVTGIVPADEFEATSWSSSDYVKVTDGSGGVCYDGGTAPAIFGNTAGIRGNARPHSPDVSIGADELEITGTGSMAGRPAWAW